jgi:predicted outer membrane protein
MIKGRWIVALAFAMSNTLYGCRPMGAEYPLGAASTRNSADDVFLQDADRNNLAAADMARLAVTASEDDVVKDFARSLYARSQATHDRLRSLALGAVSLPSEPGVDDKNKVAALAGLHGRNFDIAWLQYHQVLIGRCVGVYEKEAENGQFKVITKYVAEQLPGLLSDQKKGDSILNHF